MEGQEEEESSINSKVFLPGTGYSLGVKRAFAYQSEDLDWSAIWPLVLSSGIWTDNNVYL